MFVEKDGAKTNMLADYAQQETAKVMSYFNQQASAGFLLGEQLTGADIMMSFIVDALHRAGALPAFPNLQAYQEFLSQRPGFKKAEALELELEGQ